MKAIPRTADVGCHRCGQGGASKWGRKYNTLYPYHAECLKLETKAEEYEGVEQSPALSLSSGGGESSLTIGSANGFSTLELSGCFDPAPGFYHMLHMPKDPPSECGMCGSGLVVSVRDKDRNMWENCCLKPSCNRYWWTKA